MGWFTRPSFTAVLHKYELIRTYVQQIVHAAQRMQSERTRIKPPDAAVRLTEQFMQLVESQFPIQAPAQPLQLRTAQAFADGLNVHVNYLNRVVRQVTGRTTTTYLNGRIAQEAKALLRHTDWSVAAITNSLGFARSTNFTHFFRQQTGLSPRDFRQQNRSLN